MLTLFTISITIFVLIQIYFLFTFYKFSLAICLSFIFIISSPVLTAPVHLKGVPANLLLIMSPYSRVTCLESSKNRAAGVSWPPAHSSPDSFINLDPAIALQLHFMTQSQAVLFTQCPNLHFPRQKNIQTLFKSSLCFYICPRVSFRSCTRNLAKEMVVSKL